MKKFLKHIVRWAIRLLVLAILLAAITIYFLRDPSLFFDNNVTFKGINIYSDLPIQKDIASIMDKVEQRVYSCEIYDANLIPTVFLINDEDTYAIFTRFTTKSKYSQSVNITFFNNIFINLTQVNKTFQNHNPNLKNTQLSGELDQLIAHEFIQGYITQKVGLINQFRIPGWKKVGYSEYASTIGTIRDDKKQTLINRTKTLLDSDIIEFNTASINNYRSQLYVEYLAEVHHMNFEQIMDLPISFEDLTKEFEEWYYYNIQNKKLK